MLVESDAKKIMLTLSGQAQSQSDMFLHGVQLFLSPMYVGKLSHVILPKNIFNLFVKIHIW